MLLYEFSSNNEWNYKEAAFLYSSQANLIAVSTKCYLQNCFVSSVFLSLEYIEVSFYSGKLIFVQHERMRSASDYGLKKYYTSPYTE